MPSVRGNIYNPAHPWEDAREIFSAESTSSDTTDATGRSRAQIKRTDPPSNPVIIIGEVRCLSVVGRFFQARGVITEVHGGSDPPEMFLISGYDSGRGSTDPDFYNVVYYEPAFESCRATTTRDLAPIHDGDIVVTDAP